MSVQKQNKNPNKFSPFWQPNAGVSNCQEAVPPWPRWRYPTWGRAPASPPIHGASPHAAGWGQAGQGKMDHMSMFAWTAQHSLHIFKHAAYGTWQKEQIEGGGGGRQSLIRQRKRKWGQKGQTDREMNRGRDGAGNSCSLHSKLWWTNLKHKHTHTLWGTHRHQVTYLHICVEVHTRWQQGVQRVAKQSHQFLLVPLLPFLAPKDKNIYKAICQPQDSWVPHKKVY